MAQEFGFTSQRDRQGKELVENEKEEVNILILGETGVGKSTWINGIANYVKHNTLQEAMDDKEFAVLIPSRFTFTDDEGDVKEIEVGSDKNEVLVDGQSATQLPQEYMIEYDAARFHLIDTPGVGDCRGIEKDKENFDNILTFLTHYDKINAVVVLLKPNNARLTVAFRFCVLELLTHLHKSLVSNIIFAFTNSRGTLYRPGDTFPVLKKLLREHDVEIDLSPSRKFCFDNEAFRFLACYKNGIEFTSREIDLYSESWATSNKTTNTLFAFVMDKKPHMTKETLSLNEARSCIISLSKPMGQAVQLIKMNVKNIKDAHDQCKRDNADIKKFKELLKFKGCEVAVKKLDYPRTVCAAEECKKYVKDVKSAGKVRTIYPQICHDKCPLKGIPDEITNNKRLRGCKIMSGEKCTKCGHDYRLHMHVTYTADIIEKEYLSHQVQRIIDNKAGLKEKKTALIAELQTRKKELEEEKEIIYECASFFGVFLKENALVPYNDAFGEYLDMQIRDEKAKAKEIRDDIKIEQLENEKQAHETRKKVIEESFTSGSKDKEEVISLEKIYKMRKKLCSLKHNGKTLNEALGVTILARRNTLKLERRPAVIAKKRKFSEFSETVSKWNPFNWPKSTPED